MTSITQLYDTISKDLPSTELPMTGKDEFIKMVKKLDDKGNEIFFILMKLYEMRSCENPGIPYDGKISSDEIKFELESLPTQLQHMLFKFMSIHLKSIEEDAKIDQERRNITLDIGQNHK